MALANAVARSVEVLWRTPLVRTLIDGCEALLISQLSNILLYCNCEPEHLQREVNRLDKNEIVLQLTLKMLEKLDYNAEDYGGHTMTEHAKMKAELASRIYNDIYNEILKDE